MLILSIRKIKINLLLFLNISNNRFDSINMLRNELIPFSELVPFTWKSLFLQMQASLAF
jgi:hypothetical protein